MESQSNEYLEILHFNDVYVLTETEGEAGAPTTGGAARFVTAMKKNGCDSKLVLFSGDLLAPSLLSEFFKGMQFVEVFNALKVQVSCLGNHDVFDYGVDNFKEFDRRSRALVDEREETTDKTERKYNHWLMANCFLDREVIANLAQTHIIKQNGIKIGIIGLCDQNWENLAAAKIEKGRLSIKSFETVAQELSKKLREQEGCQYIIALTHMETENDRQLALSGKGHIDLILGGHDHISLWEEATENKVTLIKSGYDFQEFSDIKINLKDKKVERTPVVVNKNFHADPQILKVVEEYEKKVEKILNENLVFLCPEQPDLLKFKKETFRTEEHAISNLIADIVLTEPDVEVTEVVLLNGGTFRGTGDWNGLIRIKDLFGVLCVKDRLVQLKVRGKVIKDALEHSVSGEQKDQKIGTEEEQKEDYQRLDGKFLSGISGLDFTWDPKRPSGNRVTKIMMWPKNEVWRREEFDPERDYVIKVLEYMIKGGDGYSCLKANDPDRKRGKTPGDEELKGEQGDQTPGDKNTTEVPQVEVIDYKDARQTIKNVVLQALKSYRQKVKPGEGATPLSKNKTDGPGIKTEGSEKESAQSSTNLQKWKSVGGVAETIADLEEKRKELLKIDESFEVKALRNVTQQEDPEDVIELYRFKKIYPQITRRIIKLNH